MDGLEEAKKQKKEKERVREELKKIYLGTYPPRIFMEVLREMLDAAAAEGWDGR